MKFSDALHVSLQLLLRHRLLALGTVALIAVLIAAALAAEFGARQPATLALDTGLSTLRLVLPLLIVIQVQELFSSEFERKFYLLSLSYPVSRLQWFAARFSALLIITFVLLSVSVGLLALEVSIISQGYPQPTPVSLGLPLGVTTLFIALDLLVLLALACFLAIVASTPSFVLIGTLGFMLIARSYSTVLALLASNAALVDNAETYRGSLGILGYLLPDLGALDIRMVALYGQMSFLPADWPLLAGSASFYALGLTALTVWFFRRKQFT